MGKTKEYLSAMGRADGVLVLPLYASLPHHLQMKAIGAAPRHVERKVIFATNIAETSLTIDGAFSSWVCTRAVDDADGPVHLHESLCQPTTNPNRRRPLHRRLGLREAPHLRRPHRVRVPRRHAHLQGQRRAARGAGRPHGARQVLPALHGGDVWLAAGACVRGCMRDVWMGGFVR